MFPIFFWSFKTKFLMFFSTSNWEQQAYRYNYKIMQDQRQPFILEPFIFKLNYISQEKHWTISNNNKATNKTNPHVGVCAFPKGP